MEGPDEDQRADDQLTEVKYLCSFYQLQPGQRLMDYR